MFQKTIVAILLVLSMAGSASATCYVSATNGRDTNPGTCSQPFRTIARGVGVLKPGDTLFIRGGVYAESFNSNIPSGKSWLSPVTIKAYPNEQVTLRPGPTTQGVFMFSGPQQFIVISDLTIDGANVQYDCIKITSSSKRGAAHHICIQNCDVLNANAQGILISGGSYFNYLHNLKVHNSALNGRWHAMPLDHYHGIYIASSCNTVHGCTVYHNAGYGIHCYDSSGFLVNYNTICGNTCVDNGVASMSGAGIILSSGIGNQAFNNVVYGNAYGISVDYSAISTRVFNNTVYANREYGIYIGSRSRLAIVQNNISYGNGWNPDIFDNGSGQTTFMQNLAGVDPGFADPAHLDFHLVTGSPAVDHAAPVQLSAPLFQFDMDTNPRYSGTSLDIGAYEYQSAVFSAGG